MKKTTKTEPLTQQQKLFAYAYVRNKGNGMQAAIEAGYSKKSATEQASRLLTYAKVTKLITRLNDTVENRLIASQIITKEEVLREYRKIALFDLRTLYDDKNSLLPISQLSDEAGAAIAGIEVLEEFEGKGEERIHRGNTVKIKLNNKISALDSIRDTMGWKGVTKIAQTDKEGNDLPPVLEHRVVFEDLTRTDARD